MGRDVFGNDASGADDDIVSDSDTGEDGNAPSEPDVIPDRNGKSRFNARIAQIGVNGVVGGIDADIGADEGIFSDGDFSGVPDRLILLPDGKCGFVEVKASGGKPRPLQESRIRLLRQLGFKVYVLDGAEQIGGILDEING